MTATTGVPLSDERLAYLRDLAAAFPGAPWGELVAEIDRLRAAQQPRRGDAVAEWLRARRDAEEPHSYAWALWDRALDDYRLHADTGVPLGQHVCEGGTVDDCHGCYEAAQGDQPGPAALANPAEHGWEYGVRTETGFVLGPLNQTAARNALNPNRALVRRPLARGPWEETR